MCCFMVITFRISTVHQLSWQGLRGFIQYIKADVQIELGTGMTASFRIITYSLLTNISMALQPFGPCSFFSFLIIYTVGRTPWTGDQPVARPLSAHRTTQTQNKRTQTSVLRVGFEPTIPVFELALTLYTLKCWQYHKISRKEKKNESLKPVKWNFIFG
jgi:hypothetical protein